MILANLTPNGRKIVKELVATNAYPGITDDQMKRTTFMTSIPTMAQKYNGDVHKAIDAFLWSNKYDPPPPPLLSPCLLHQVFCI